MKLDTILDNFIFEELSKERREQEIFKKKMESARDLAVSEGVDFDEAGFQHMLKLTGQSKVNLPSLFPKKLKTVNAISL